MDRKKTVKVSQLLAAPFLFLKDRPVIYRGENFTIVGYGLSATLNALAVISIATLYLYTKGVSLSAGILLMFPLMGAGVWVGSKVMHILALGKKFFRHPFKYLAETGFYVQGGIIGAVVSAWMAAWVIGAEAIMLLDGLGWSAMLGLFFGRLGCFNYGCCFGREIHGHGGICYHNRETKILRLRPELAGKSVHPSQIYTALTHFVAFTITTIALTLTTLPNGVLAGGFLLYHGLSRMWIERFRADLFFDEGRNWTTFRSAGGLALFGAFILIFGSAVFAGAGVTVPTSRPVSIPTFVVMIAENPWFLVSALALGSFVFFGYGVHGRKLGTFPWSPENSVAAEKNASTDTVRAPSPEVGG